MDNELIMEIIDMPDGSSRIIRNPEMITFDYWGEWDKCLGTVGAPFKSNSANNIFDLVANASTVGLWTPAVWLVCLGVAGGLNHINAH